MIWTHMLGDLLRRIYEMGSIYIECEHALVFFRHQAARTRMIACRFVLQASAWITFSVLIRRGRGSQHT